MSRPRRVLAIGWFGEGNLGDEAMLEGLLRFLGRALGPVDATVLTADPEGTGARFNVTGLRRAAPEASGFRNTGLLRASLGADLVTLGGGDLIREQADGTVPALNWLARVRVPLRLGRPVALVGVSVGELHTPAVIDRVARELRRFRLLAARDSGSARRLEALTGRPVHVMGDLALETLETVAPPAACDPGAAPRIGVATRNIIGRGASVAEDAGDTLNAALAAALDRVVEVTRGSIELVPFRAGRARRDDDARAGEALAALAAQGEGWTRHPAPVDAAAFGALAAGLDLVVGVRLHAAVLGAAAGRPVLGIAYDPKIPGFLDDLGLPEQALPIDASADRIADAILRSLADESLPGRVAAGVTAMRERTRALEPALGAAAGAGPRPRATVGA